MLPNKTQFNQGRLFFFDDVVHAIAVSLCGKLLAVGGRFKVPTVFLNPRFSESDVVGGAATSAANTVTLTLHTTPKRWSEECFRQDVGGGSLWRGIVPRPHYFEISHWARLRPLPRRGLDLGCDWTLARVDIKSAGFTDVSNRLWPSLLMSRGPRQLRLDSGSLPAGWFPLPDAVVEAFGLPPICLPTVRLRCPLSSFGVSVDC